MIAATAKRGAAANTMGAEEVGAVVSSPTGAQEHVE